MSYLTEEDIKQRYITPAIKESAGWAGDQLSMEYFFTDGQMIIQGKRTRRGKPKKADYILTSQESHIPLAVVEAKDQKYGVEYGLQQAKGYAAILDIPFAYASNGFEFIEYDDFTKQERIFPLDEFPTEEELWSRYYGKNLNSEQEEIISEPYYFDTFTQKTPRYYQRIAIDRSVEVISKGKKRQLLVMATGTGKTYTAFQIIYRLLKAGVVKRVLYLADRNILIDQTMQDDFKPFERIMTKVQNRYLDSSYEVYMSLYQQLAGDEGEEPFREFKPEFFDLIIVDECHRGSARKNSEWRKVLDYFSDACHIGMTATPKETEDISNSTYFGEPIYTYSLKQGIEDGFLAPYKVIRVGLDKDLEGWRPLEGQLDIYGNVIPDREYASTDFDRNLIIDERTQMVAHRVTQWLRKNGRDSKTIIFCVDVDHAERMRRALLYENTDIGTDEYVARITGDSPTSTQDLDKFMDPGTKYPTIATTAELMTTGVNAKTVKLIVLDSIINSMTVFKQIIGRGTRLYPDLGKNYFTIMDFRNASRLFADPDFDGYPAKSFEWPPDGEVPDDDDQSVPDDEGESLGPDMTPTFIEPRDREPKYRVRGVPVAILNERVQYIDPKTGKLITESITDFSKKNILNEYASLDHFIQAWSQTEKKGALLIELFEQGVFLDEIRREAGETVKDMDDFDLILHVAYDKKPLTKRERIDNVKKRDYLSRYSEDCQKVLSALMDKYMNEGISELEDTRVLENEPFNQIGSPTRIARLFGGRQAYLKAVKELETEIYKVA